MIAAWLALIAAVPTPPVIRESAAPVAVSMMRGIDRAPIETLSFAVVIRQDAKPLWQGKLAMASNGTASYTQRREETLACPTADRRDRPTRFFTGTTLTLSTAWDGGDQSAIRVSAALDRPVPDGSTDVPLSAICRDLTNRKVQIDTTIRPGRGKPVTIQGDAGFSVTLALD